MRFFEKIPVKVEGMVKGTMEYYLIEIKPLFSIILTYMPKGGMTAMHTHPFKALTFILKGSINEYHLDDETEADVAGFHTGQLKATNEDFHAVGANENTWFLTFRGPWKDTWQEVRNEKIITFTHGRKEIA